RHALKTGILPVVTVMGIEFAFLIGGLVVTETVFNLPGLARFLVQAILWRDYPIVQNLVMLIAIAVILSNLLVDMLYGVLDPRVRYASSPTQGHQIRAGLSRRRCRAAGRAGRGHRDRSVLQEETPRRRGRRDHAADPAHRGLRQPAADLRSDRHRRRPEPRLAQSRALARLRSP